MQVVDAEPHHITQFTFSNVRQADIDEWVLGSGMRYQDILLQRLDLETQYVRALLNDGGTCIALWGVSSSVWSEVGNVWLIANKEAESVGRRIHKLWPEEVGRMHMRHAQLHALAYANNALHLKWLGQIGFTVQQRVAIGPGSVPFVLYVRQQECAHQSH